MHKSSFYTSRRERARFATCVARRTLAQQPLLYSQWLIPTLLCSNPSLLSLLLQLPLALAAKAPVTCLLLFTFPLGSSTPSRSCYTAHMLLLLLLFNPRAIWRAYPWQCLGRRPGLVAEVWVISFSQGGAGRRSQPWQPFTQPAQSGQPPRHPPTHTHTLTDHLNTGSQAY